MTFRWNAVHGADRYILHVETESGDVVIREENLAGTSFTTNGPLAFGGYRIWVKVISNQNPDLGLWSLQRTLRIAATASVESNNVIDEALEQLAVTGF